MNNGIITLCLFITILSSCTKGNFNTEIVPNVVLEESEVFIYSQPAVNSERIVSFNPPSVNLYCQDIPAIIVPQIHVGESIELIFATVQGYTGAIRPKAIKWKVNGETKLQLTSHLKLPYATGFYDVNVLVALPDGQQLDFNFTLDVSNDMVLVNDGFIDYFGCSRCLTILDVYSCCSNHHRFSFVCPDYDFEF